MVLESLTPSFSSAATDTLTKVSAAIIVASLKHNIIETFPFGVCYECCLGYRCNQEGLKVKERQSKCWYGNEEDSSF